MIPLPLPWKLLAIAFALAVAWTTGWRMRATHEAAARLAAERAAHETYVKTVEGWQAAAQAITTEREKERQHAQNDRRTWQQQLDAARRAVPGGSALAGPGLAHQPGPGGAGCPVPAVPRGLWHGALGIGLPAALGPWAPDGAGPPADPPAAAVPLDTALENLADNGQVCNDLRGLLLDWQAWARSIGAAP